MMKRGLLILVLLSAFNLTYAQDCNLFFPMEKGVKFEITNYDKKNAVTGKVNHVIKEYSGTASGAEAKVEAKTLDVKGKELVTTNYIVKCKDGKFYLDMSTLVPSDKMASAEGMEMEMAESYLEFPNDVKIGDKLPDGKVNVKFKSNGVSIMSIVIDITDRQIVGEEDITTPAGTFKCLKIKQRMVSKIGMMSSVTTTVSWFSVNVGMVKQEMYDKKEKYIGKSELTAFSK